MAPKTICCHFTKDGHYSTHYLRIQYNYYQISNTNHLNHLSVRLIYITPELGFDNISNLVIVSLNKIFWQMYIHHLGSSSVDLNLLVPPLRKVRMHFAHFCTFEILFLYSVSICTFGDNNTDLSCICYN